MATQVIMLIGHNAVKSGMSRAIHGVVVSVALIMPPHTGQITRMY